MARNGSGTMNPISNSWYPTVNGQLAQAGDWQAIYLDLIAALTQSLSRDGQGPMTGNLNLGNNKIVGLSDGTGTGQAVSFEQLFNQGTEEDLASAATTDIGAKLTNFLRITGTTTITSFGTNYKGPRFLRFAGAVTLTNSSTLILPGGANITTAAGDCCIAIPKATLGTADGWQVVAYQKNAVPGVITDGSVTTAKIADSSVTTAKIAANAVTPAKMANGGAEFGMRNRIINGDMRIDQRNAGASGTGNQYTTDRWAWYSPSVKGTWQQNSGSVTPPSGFTNYWGFTTTSAYTVTANDTFSLYHRIEGYNTADFGWGAAGAASVTLSFWVRSSLTGTFGGSVKNASSTRSYPFSYTISAANTWEYKTVNIPGDTTGTWLTNNGIGIDLTFGLGIGSTYSASAGAWVSGHYQSATGATSVVGTSGATFYITGVQLEKGSTATSFDYRPYGTELQLCQRYYYQVNSTSTQYAPLGSAYARTTTIAVAGGVSLPVTMRSIPTLTATNTAGAFGVSIGGSDYSGATVSLASQISASAVSYLLTLGSGTMTVGQGGQMYITNNATYFVGLSAEL